MRLQTLAACGEEEAVEKKRLDDMPEAPGARTATDTCAFPGYRFPNLDSRVAGVLNPETVRIRHPSQRSYIAADSFRACCRRCARLRSSKRRTERPKLL